MSFTKPETEKSDEKKPSKPAPFVWRNSNQPRPVPPKICINVPTPRSKISKRDVSLDSLSKPSHSLERPAFQAGKLSSQFAIRPVLKPKPVETKKPSRSSMSLSLPKTISRQQVSASTRSNIASQQICSPNLGNTIGTHPSQLAEKILKAAERAAVKKNILAFESIKEKVRTYQTEFLKKWEVVKNELPPEEGEFRLIGVVKNTDGQLLARNTQKFKIKCSPKSLELFRKDMHEYIQNRIHDALDQFTHLSAKVGDYFKGEEWVNEIEEVKKTIKSDSLNALGDMLKQIESEQPTAIAANLELKVTELLKEADDLRKNLEERQTELIRITKSEDGENISHTKELEERDKKLAEKQLEVDDLRKKFEFLEKDVRKDKLIQKELNEKLNMKTAEIEDLKERLRILAQPHGDQACHVDEAKIKKLEADLKAAFKEVEKRTQIENYIPEQTCEIKTLKQNLSVLRDENQKLQTEIQKLNKELIKYQELDRELVLYRDKVKELETENENLRQTIMDLKTQFNESQISADRTLNKELTRLQRSDSEKTQRIDVLEMELSKVHVLNQNLREKIEMDRKLLKIRCSLFESLETKECTQKAHVEELFSEVVERNNNIQKLKAELLTKTEDFQNVFATLSAKQLELTRHENTIKQLQESVERAQKLGAKQEAKIGCLEEEVAKLKQTISLYQKAVLPNNLQLEEPHRDSDCNDNMGFYVDERRRKRHIDINVKKYEK